MNVLRLGGFRIDTFVCSNCGDEYPLRQVKEVFWEEGRKRLKEELCPSCLDQRMNRANQVRGIVGQKKAAAIHVNLGSPEQSNHISIGRRAKR